VLVAAGLTLQKRFFPDSRSEGAGAICRRQDSFSFGGYGHFQQVACENDGHAGCNAGSRTDPRHFFNT
jgi:hypothetical protein